MSKDSFGAEMNVSMVVNDGLYEVGMNYRDSDGHESSSYSQSYNLETGIQNVCKIILEDLSKQNKEKELADQNKKNAERIKELEQQVNSLTVDKQALEKRIQNLANSKIQKENNENKCQKQDKKDKCDTPSLLDDIDLINLLFYGLN